jgi:hypothetical protein
MRLQLVLAGLARQDDDKGEAEVVDDGILDGVRDLHLVGSQLDVTGMRPRHRAATDRLAHTRAEIGLIRHFPPPLIQGTFFCFLFFVFYVLRFTSSGLQCLNESRQGGDLAVSDYYVHV